MPYEIAAERIYQLAEYQGEAEKTAVANEESPVSIFQFGWLDFLRYI